MAFEIIKKEYKHKNCDELNKELDEYLSNLSFQSEGLAENFMDITLDHTTQKEKEWIELWDSPSDWIDSKIIQTQREVLDRIVEDLTNIVFIDRPKRQPKMNAEASREWVIDNVKPLVLSDITVQSKIAEKLNVNGGLVSERVTRGYNKDWKTYVEGVQHARY